MAKEWPSALASYVAFRLASLGLVATLLLAAGCGGPAGVAPPDWEPDAMADAAMELNDKNRDGVLDKVELAAAPGLQAAAMAEGGSADADGDGKLSRDEVRERIAYYQETAQGMQSQGFEVRLGGQKVAGAQVEMTPEPFLQGVLKPAKGTTREDGWVLPGVEVHRQRYHSAGHGDHPTAGWLWCTRAARLGTGKVAKAKTDRDFSGHRGADIRVCRKQRGADIRVCRKPVGRQSSLPH
jgi:hypothetical protein